MEGFLLRSGSSSMNINNNQMKQHSYMEKRQVFLRSYQFSRKTSFLEKIKITLLRVKRLFLLRLRSAFKIRRMIWSTLIMTCCRFRSGTTGCCYTGNNRRHRHYQRRYRRSMSTFHRLV
ncbi:hypothetical protein MKX01_025472 [Papaver californicum]|nr:hypothetical protein MKX01_025472 [Papaver californicum]